MYIFFINICGPCVGTVGAWIKRFNGTDGGFFYDDYTKIYKNLAHIFAQKNGSGAKNCVRLKIKSV